MNRWMLLGYFIAAVSAALMFSIMVYVTLWLLS